MYDASHKKKNCVDDPPYDPSYCGFSDHPGTYVVILSTLYLYSFRSI